MAGVVNKEGGTWTADRTGGCSNRRHTAGLHCLNKKSEKNDGKSSFSFYKGCRGAEQTRNASLNPASPLRVWVSHHAWREAVADEFGFGFLVWQAEVIDAVTIRPDAAIRSAVGGVDHDLQAIL